VTGSSGNTPARQRFDPFGGRISLTDPSWADDPPAQITRGFTGREMDDYLINMRLRMYEPMLARFMTPDPLVQAPFAPKNYDRYAYAFNNPTRFVDPSEFCSTGDEHDCTFGQE
jgi:RHS repeat-associated protein